MSLRISKPTRVAPPRAEAPISCGAHADFEGTAIPCGLIVSPMNSFENAFIVTSKTKGQLDHSGNRLVVTTPDTLTANQMDTKRQMNLSLKTSIYRETYKYALSLQNEQFNATAELSNMGAVAWYASAPTQQAYDEIVSECVDAYGAACGVTAFRKL